MLNVVNGQVAAAASIVAAIGWAIVWSLVFWLGIVLRNLVLRLADICAAKLRNYAALR
jgi:hypothetical protein